MQPTQKAAPPIFGVMLKESERNVGAKGSIFSGNQGEPVKDTTPTLSDLLMPLQTSFVFRLCPKTPAGRFFLVGESGMMGRYSRVTEDGRSAGSEVIPLTDKEAVWWVQQRLSGENVERFLGGMFEEA
jgi:hypothetical protein